MVSFEDRCVGLLLGGACGDALGAPAEFKTLAQVNRMYGTLTDFKPYGRHPAGTYTDDAEMMLSVADWLVGGDDSSQAAAECAVNWYNRPPYRGYGPNTKGALERVFSGVHASESADENAKPSNGAAARVGPIGLMTVREEIADEVFVACQWSHKQKLSLLAANWMAEAIHDLSRGGVLPELPPDSPATLEDLKHMSTGEVIDLVPPNGFCSGFAIGAMESICLTAWAFQRWADPEISVIESVSIGGDADTIGCMVGQLCGAKHGLDWIPKRWKDGVESSSDFGYPAIVDLGKKLAALGVGNEVAMAPTRNDLGRFPF